MPMGILLDVWGVEAMGIAQSLRQSVSLKFAGCVTPRTTVVAVVLRRCVLMPTALTNVWPVSSMEIVGEPTVSALIMLVNSATWPITVAAGVIPHSALAVPRVSVV